MTLNKQTIVRVDDTIEELSQNRAKRHGKGKYKTTVAQLVKTPLAEQETWV